MDPIVTLGLAAVLSLALSITVAYHGTPRFIRKRFHQGWYDAPIARAIDEAVPQVLTGVREMVPGIADEVGMEVEAVIKEALKGAPRGRKGAPTATEDAILDGASPATIALIEMLPVSRRVKDLLLMDPGRAEAYLSKAKTISTPGADTGSGSGTASYPRF